MRLIGLVLGAALAIPSAALVGPAAAQPAPAPASSPAAPPAAPLTVTPQNPEMIARRMARRAARVDRDIETLRAGLQLTPAQAALWPPVAAAIHAVDTARGFRFKQTMENAPSQVDGLKMQGDHMAAMGAAIARLADATKPLVASLTPDQKSRIPSLLQGVRLPKVMGRALDVPKDTSAPSWGIGDEAPAGGAGTPAQGAAAQPMPAPAAAPPAGAANAPKPDSDEE